MRRLLLVTLFAACHQASAPPRDKTETPRPPDPAPVPVVSESCGRSAPKLVTAWSHRWSDDEQNMARTKLDELCKTENWKPAVEACIAGRGDPWRCVDAEHLVAKLPPAGLSLTCDEAMIHDARSIGVVVTDDEVMAIGQQVMKNELPAICTKQGWSHTMLGCLRYVGRDSAKIQSCTDSWLTDEQAKELAARFTALATNVNSWVKAPPSCQQVAQAYYSDEAWASHPTPQLSDARRKQAIADSRRLLATHCKTQMSAVLRGCVANARSQEGAWNCWWHSEDHTASRWSFPVKQSG